MMGFPKRFKLANRTWRVKLVTFAQLSRKLAREGIEPASGVTDPNNATIWIAKDLDPGLVEHTFYHELVHALKYARGEVDHDEVEVDGLGALLHQYIISRRGEQ